MKKKLVETYRVDQVTRMLMFAEIAESPVGWCLGLLKTTSWKTSASVGPPE